MKMKPIEELTSTNRCEEDTGLELGDMTRKVIFNTSAFEREQGLVGRE